MRKHFNEIIVHTGQHYDANLSQKFFEELKIPEPDINLGIGSESNAVQTGRMLVEIEKQLNNYRPDMILVYGDTNSILAGGIAATKLNIPIAHVEAGLRSFNRKMPEEINRIFVYRLSSLLFCPTPTAVENLKSEGFDFSIVFSGDVMYDSVLYNVAIAEKKSIILGTLKLKPGEYYVATIDCSENTNNLNNLRHILEGLTLLNRRVILPIHPRTSKVIQNNKDKISFGDNIKFIEPIGYRDMLMLQKFADIILTDSGEIQKEAYFLRTPC